MLLFLVVLLVVCGLRASVRLAHVGDWFASWVLLSVFSAAGRGTVQAWFSTALDIEESLSGIVDSDVHILLLTLSSHVILLTGVFLTAYFVAWGCQFRFVMFIFAHVRLRFKLACGLGESDGAYLWDAL